MPKNRLEAFTDAVIAIIMTILVLELHKPEGDTWAALTALGNRFFIYIVSFVILGIYWNNHHHLFQVVHKINGRVLWANSFFIFALSLFPFATSWISEYINSLTPEITYGVVTLVANIAYYILARELVNANKGHEKGLKKLLNNYKKSYLSISLNVLGILLGYLIAPVAVLIANIVILMAWFIPSRAIESQYK
ncbi:MULTISPECIES: TMEM175 family protein [unclassified Enterococcus]|uniref:TMEM175 family protein n=1 Tax=unclassified Enterococcus TaxID=2608891 RepID=UPI0013EC84CE|nr:MULTISPECIES: TMEM175 family protein [unclassified Enterococcus]